MADNFTFSLAENTYGAYFNWSSGKHSAMALYYAIKYGKHEVLSLFTIDKNAGTKIAMHEIGIDL